MKSRELKRSWAITREHLAKAQAALQAALPGDRATFAAYDDWLDHNELELALDELETLADDSAVNSGTFWREALAAAENMGLAIHAQRYRDQLQRSV